MTKPQIEIVRESAQDSHGLAVIRGDAVWLTFHRPWWDFVSWAWWLLVPGKRAWILLRKGEAGRVRVRAKRVATQHVRMSP